MAQKLDGVTNEALESREVDNCFPVDAKKITHPIQTVHFSKSSRQCMKHFVPALRQHVWLGHVTDEDDTDEDDF
jgi:hypothetical protein